MPYQEYILGKKAEEYARKKVSACGKSLSLDAFSKVIGSDLHITTYLPVEYDIQKITNYEYGGIAKSSVTDKWIDSKISKFISENANHVVAYEHALSLPGDFWLQQIVSTSLIFKNEIYFVVNSSALIDISKARRLASSALVLIALMIQLPDRYKKLTGKMDETLFSLLSANVKKLIVSAFDGEGYLIIENK